MTAEQCQTYLGAAGAELGVLALPRAPSPERLGCSWAVPGLLLGCSWAAPARVWQREPLDVTAGLLLPAGLGVPRILQTLPLLSGLARSRSLSLWPCLVPLLADAVIPTVWCNK